MLAELGWRVAKTSTRSSHKLAYFHELTGEYVMLKVEMDALKQMFEEYAQKPALANLSIDGVKRMQEAALQDQFDEIDGDHRSGPTNNLAPDNLAPSVGSAVCVCAWCGVGVRVWRERESVCVWRECVCLCWGQPQAVASVRMREHSCEPNCAVLCAAGLWRRARSKC